MKILVAGDFCPQNRVAELVENGDYSFLDDVKETIKRVDYSVVNFECPVTYGDEKPNLERLSLHCSENGMDAISYAGFNCVTLANNHFRDWGDGGVSSTLNACKKYGIDYVGGGDNLESAQKTLIKTINEERIAIINCCEHEFSLASSTRGGSNPLNLVNQYNAIQQARALVKYVIVIVHGGHEHFQYPSNRMIESYRFFIDAGADAVINHHQHCISGYEIYKNRPIFYGIGNFCFDMQNPPTSLWHTGYMVGLELDDNKVNFELYPYIQCKERASIKFIDKKFIDEEVKLINRVIATPNRLKKEIEKYYDASMSEIKNVLNPMPTVRILWRFYNKKWFPNVITKKWIMFLCNYTMCESHRDKLDYFFEHNMYK